MISLFYEYDHQLPEESYPKYFHVSTNNKVANSLGFTIDSAEDIEKKISEIE